MHSPSHLRRALGSNAIDDGAKPRHGRTLRIFRVNSTLSPGGRASLRAHTRPVPSPALPYPFSYLPPLSIFTLLLL